MYVGERGEKGRVKKFGETTNKRRIRQKPKIFIRGPIERAVSLTPVF